MRLSTTQLLALFTGMLLATSLGLGLTRVEAGAPASSAASSRLAQDAALMHAGVLSDTERLGADLARLARLPCRAALLQKLEDDRSWLSRDLRAERAVLTDDWQMLVASAQPLETRYAKLIRSDTSAAARLLAEAGEARRFCAV